MRCILENVGPSEKVAGYHKYRCVRPGCGLEGHSPHAAVWVGGVERVVGPLCLGMPFEGEELEWLRQRREVSIGKPGTAAAIIFRDVGAKRECGGKCAERAAQMDVWGVDGCLENREKIIGWFRESYADLTWTQTASVGLRLMGEGWFRVSDPLESVLDEAIARSRG